MTYYPSVGEGSVVGGLVAIEEGAAPRAFHRRGVRGGDDPSARSGGAEPPPQQAADDAARAERRARAQIRRYAIANRCLRLLTLTYRPPQPVDPVVVQADVARFLRRLRAERPELAYVWVMERHKSGAIHVHVGLGSRGKKLSVGRVTALWGHGYIYLQRFRQGGRRETARAIARYLAKYVGKDAVRRPGGHRYDVRQGLQPEVIRAAAYSLEDGWRELVGLAGGEVPSYQWQSGAALDWRGPPVWFVAWD